MPSDKSQKLTSELKSLKSTNRILIVALVIAAFFIGSLTNSLSSKKTTTTTNDSTAQPQAAAGQQAVKVSDDQIKALFTDKNLVFGDKNSKNLIVEIADPSCPYCHIAGGENPELNQQAGSQFTLVSDGGTYVAPVPEMKKLVDSGKAAFVYIYFPGHGNGEMGAKALYCANEKGKFWDVNSKLMSNDGYNLLNNDVKNDKTKSQTLADFLSGAIDSSFMKSCLDSGKYDAKLQEDITTAQSLGAQATPDFFINTTQFTGAYSWKDMESAVN